MMCASNVYLVKGEDEQLVMKDVAEIRVEGGKLLLTGLLGEKKEIEGELVRLDLEGHAIYIRER